MKYIYSILILIVLAYFIGLNVTTVSITDTFKQQLQATLVGVGMIAFLIGFATASYYVFKPSKRMNNEQL